MEGTRIVKFVLPALVMLTFFSGVYRDDTEIEKYLALAREDRFKGVGQVLVFERGEWVPGGSFILIDSVTLLTAAHVVVRTLKKDTVVYIDGKKVSTYVSKGKTARDKAELRFLVMNTLVRPGAVLLHPEYLKNGSCDIALIKLETPVHGCPVLPLYTLKDEKGDTVTGVGFGASGPAGKPELVKTYHIKLAGKNIIDSLGGDPVAGHPSMLFADFDAPDERSGCNQCGSPEPLELEFCTAGGDSGGPLFIFRNGRMYLAGITSSGGVNIRNLLKNGYYCQVSGWTRISVFADWIGQNR